MEQKNTGVIEQPSSPAGAAEESVKTPTVTVETTESQEPQKPPKGYVPYQALEEERRLRKELEAKLENQVSVSSEDVEDFSEEGKRLKSDIVNLNEKLKFMERREARRETEAEFPELRELKEKFDSFLEDEENRRLSIKKAATLFLAEQGITKVPRKGLEKPVGGGKTPPTSELSVEEVAHLMKNDWKQYEKLLRAGKIGR